MSRDYWFAFGSRPAANTGLNPTFITFVNGSGVTIAPPTITETFVGSGLYRVNYNPTQTIAFVVDGATTGLSDSNRYISGVFDPQDQFGTTLLNISDRSMTLIAMGNTMIALGISGVALGNTGIATTISYGSTSAAVGSTLTSLVVTDITNGLATGVTLVAQGVTITAMGDTLLSIGTGNIAGIGSTASSFGDVSQDPVTVFGYLKRVVEFLEGNQNYAKATGGLTFSSRGSSYVLANKIVDDTTTNTTKT